MRFVWRPKHHLFLSCLLTVSDETESSIDLLDCLHHAHGLGWALRYDVAAQCSICDRSAHRAVASLVAFGLVRREYRKRISYRGGMGAVWLRCTELGAALLAARYRMEAA